MGEEEACNNSDCPCELEETEWTEWSDCTVGCGDSGTGTRYRSREVVVGTGATCSIEDKVEAIICDGCTTTTSAPTTTSATGTATGSTTTTTTTTTSTTTTTANPCP